MQRDYGQDAQSRARLGGKGTLPQKARRALTRWMFHSRNRHLLVWDLITQPCVVLLAFMLRLDGLLPQPYTRPALLYALLTLPVKFPIYYFMDMYRRFWRYAGFDEVRLILTSATVASAVQALLVFLVFLPLGRMGPVPRSIPFLDMLLASAALALPRLVLRAGERRWMGRQEPASSGLVKRVLIIGAGETGHVVYNELERNPQLGFQLVGLIDDDPVKQGLKTGQCSVLGTCAQIPDLVKSLGIQAVIIAVPSGGGKLVRRIVSICQGSSVEVLVFPGLAPFFSDTPGLQHLHKVNIEDLLRREPIRIDRTQVEGLLRSQRVLVTGGGGSIGSELCRQIAVCQPAELMVLGHGEHSVYRIVGELRSQFAGLAIRPIIADIRDSARLEQVFARLRPQLVFHAAAHKHVPLMEENAEDAITNNVLGTRNLVEMASLNGTTHLVSISTDKAVNPSSVMGATKRLAELLIEEAAHRTGRCFVSVRFGNVLGSRDSIVPLFREQIGRGGPVTVTHPEVKRYFMTIPEAVQLVLQAAALGHGGETFVLDMGEPLKILDLACDMISLSGLRPGVDIDIDFVGLRPGEKLFEELVCDDEHAERSLHEMLLVCRNGAARSDEDYQKLHAHVDELVRAARNGDREHLMEQLCLAVPTFCPVGPRPEQGADVTDPGPPFVPGS